MAIIDIVKWNASDDLYAWKFPSEELSTWTQLIVSESQEAVLLKGGQMLGPFGPGRHTLSTENIPLLTSLFSLPFGGRSPFTAEVWFVNKAIPLDVKWGTAEPMQVLDPLYQVMLPVRANGQYGVQIEDTKRFLIKLVGTMSAFDREKLVSYFRGVIVTKAKDAIAKIILQQNVSILKVASRLNEISESLKQQLTPDLEEFGLKVVNFYVSSISTPEDDPAVQKMKAALAKRAEMNIVGFTYQQERQFDVLQTAAGNEGQANSTLMGAGMGLGMGVAMGNALNQSMGSAAQNIQTATASIACPKCNVQNPAGARFCTGCGNQFNAPPQAPTIKCGKCNAESPQGAKFCSGCGQKLAAFCIKCGQELMPDSKFCANCGQPQQ
ncbi:MAG: SPFH domain-containing protein [Methylotenera sp.]|nr:SPFH domain-containing protein [Methylotenera sp.]MDP3094016.1 SPFH domain-containing protein [Methylotenera sp.]